jgi:hypothetical protein
LRIDSAIGNSRYRCKSLTVENSSGVASPDGKKNNKEQQGSGAIQPDMFEAKLVRPDLTAFFLL